MPKMDRSVVEFDHINLNCRRWEDLKFTCYKNKRHYHFDLGKREVMRDDGVIKNIVRIEKTFVYFEPFDEIIE